MGNIKRRPLRLLYVASLSVVATAPLYATEGGGGVYPEGGENYLVAAMPPPGIYWMNFVGYDHLSNLRDNNGDVVHIPFDVDVSSLALRGIWVTDTKILGGQLAWHTIIPILNIQAGINGLSQHKFGVGDVVFGPSLGYHVSDKLHYVVALDINTPTGGYHKNDLINLGRNYWNLEPVLGVTYTQPYGINADIKVMYDFNAKNDDTDYKSGQEFHFDYDLGFGLGNGWILGVGGYYYKQVTPDRRYGAVVPDNIGRAMSIGPSVMYNSGKGFFITMKAERDFLVRNRAEDTALKVKFTVPLR